MNLELYHRESCPYSAEVRNFISENDLEDVVSYYDVGKDGSKLTQLKSMTDDEQVPCLVIDGEPLLESADIIAWLDKNKGEFLC